MEIVFIIAIILCIVALALSLRARIRNPGFFVTTVFLIACNVLCILLIRSQTLKGARNLLFAYYIIFCWMFLSALWTIIKTITVKKYLFGLIPIGLLCAFLTYVVVFCFNAPNMLSFSKNIFFGRIWWVAEAVPDSGLFPSLFTFVCLSVVAYIYNIAVSFICLLNIHKLFRGKYLVLIILQAILMTMLIVSHIFSLPVWIYTLVMDPICYLTYYYIFVQSDNKLRNEVIMTFANDMSDGLILYNGNRDLIHMNDLIRNLLDSELLEKLKSIDFLEEWSSQVEYIENIKTRPYKKGDEDIYFIVKKRTLGTEKNEIGTVYTLHDTTNSIRQIRLMKTVNYELERTSQMKSDFLANMSHELRTPMNAVIGMAQIALREENLSPKLKDCLHQINSSGKSLLNIINDILDYSKIDAGKMEIIPEKYEPLSEVNDISNILQTRIGDKNIELYFIVDPSIPHSLIGDSMRIRQVLINLANNAVKFSQVGKIRISVDCERLSEEEVNLNYHIKDTGQGIKEEDLKKLFVSFTQVDSKRNRNVEGTGLGLAISKKLVEAMGGKIGVDSEYGKGSDFWFNVPQKISDSRSDLIVEDADKKFAYCLNENNLMTDEFDHDMSLLGVDHRVVRSLDEYTPTGKKDYFFIEEDYYREDFFRLLENNPQLTGVILTGFGSDFKPSHSNTRVMMRPQTTLSLVLTLNGADISDMNFSPDDDRCSYFTAPTARILIVDDNSINLTIAVGLLEPMKINCEVALSGAEAIEKLKRDKFDLILMDHMMPGMDGIETTREIREHVSSAADTPIVALTANVVEGSKDIFLDAGMVDMIAKPIDVRQLNNALYAWLPEYKIEHMDAEDIEDRKKGESGSSGKYDCLDCETAIKGLGSPALFEKIVGEYYKRGPRTLSEIEEALAAGDLADYAIKTHALKSSSRQIGAMELGDLAEKLEMAGKAGDASAIDTYHSPAMELLKKLLTDLSGYFSEEDGEAEELPPISDDELSAILDELSAACDNLEMDDMETCTEKLKAYSYPGDKKEKIERLCEAVEMMDIESCADIINEIKS